MKAKVVALNAREAQLKRKIRAHLKALGFARDEFGRLTPKDLTKDSYRLIHAHQRAEKVAKNATWLVRNQDKLIKHLASGDEVVPARISPALQEISGNSWESDLFRFASLNWRVPVSDGYGRRMRFLVWDENNGKLIGLIALGDAVFNQKARDSHIGWDHHQRGSALVNLMDAYVLGAIPPYSQILGGKLVASLLKTTDVSLAFRRKYSDSIGVISGEKKGARLAAITTSSALGRSSVYNRLKLDGDLILRPIGFTSGWGHFHFSGTLFDDMRQYLADVDDGYAHDFEFGSGPNWKIRLIRKTLERLRMDTSLAQHGFTREMFIAELGSNAIAYLNGQARRLSTSHLRSAAEVGAAALTRWVVPRSERDDAFRQWRPGMFLRTANSSCDVDPVDGHALGA
jgi:hypothetical protein